MPASNQNSRKYPRFARSQLCAVAVGVILSISAHSLAQQNLPSMGEPADSALSPIEEQRLGRQFMREIRYQLPLIRDVAATEYVRALGQRLAIASGKGTEIDFTFFIINDRQVNAFAIPGGYVGINLGLIDAMDFEEQLASVVAHEVAHVTQRHHARAFALSTQYSARTAATILAALLIGQASVQAGQAALAAGLAANQHAAVNFTRSNEMEADRIGIEILTNARYNPSAMAESFAILRRKNQLNVSRGALQYLRTHPLDNNRIAEAKDRAGAAPTQPRAPQIDFQMFKARLSVLSTPDRAQLLRTYQAEYDRAPSVEATYGIALLHSESNRFEQSLEYLDRLKKMAPNAPLVELSRASILERQNKLDESLAILEPLHENHPERFSVVEQLAEAQSQNRQMGKAIRTTTQYLRRVDSPNPLAWRQLAQLQERAGDQADSHESLSRYFTSIDEYGRAQSQLMLALQLVVPDSKDELRLEASLAALRGVPPNGDLDAEEAEQP